MIKKQLPLILVKGIINAKEEFRTISNKNSSVIMESKQEHKLLRFKDTDNNSTFYFELEEITFSPQNGLYSKISYAPKSQSDIKPYSNHVPYKDSVSAFQRWIGLINEYNTHELTDDEKFKKIYEEEFYSDFKIVDDDANEIPFNFSQQLILNNYLANVIGYLENLEASEIEIAKKEELLNDVRQLQKEMSVDTKNGFIRKFSSFLAKTRKMSIKACGFIAKEFAKEVIKEGVKRGFNFGIEHLPHYIENIKHMLS